MMLIEHVKKRKIASILILPQKLGKCDINFIQDKKISKTFGYRVVFFASMIVHNRVLNVMQFYESYCRINWGSQKQNCRLVSTANSCTAPPGPIDWCHGQFSCPWSPGLCHLLQGGLHHHHQPGLPDNVHWASFSVHHHHVQCILFSLQFAAQIIHKVAVFSKFGNN